MKLLYDSGIGPFVFAAVCMLAGLTLAGWHSRKKPAAQAKPWVYAGNGLAVLGLLLGCSLRQTDLYRQVGRGLPGPELVLWMLGAYIPLHFLLTTYTQYRKAPHDTALAGKTLRDAVLWLFVLLFAFTAALLMVWLPPR